MIAEGPKQQGFAPFGLFALNILEVETRAPMNRAWPARSIKTSSQIESRRRPRKQISVAGTGGKSPRGG
jgi:hypothetical protein